MARRPLLPVELELELAAHRLPEPVEVAAYYVVCEAVANATKHSEASRVRVCLQVRDGTVRIVVDDHGRGGADLGGGSGLVGLMDRVEALGGRMRLTSSAGSGTSVTAELPDRTPADAVNWRAVATSSAWTTALCERPSKSPRRGPQGDSEGHRAITDCHPSG